MKISNITKHKMTNELFSKYLKLIARLCSFGLVQVVTKNYTVNPGKIYPPLLPNKVGCIVDEFFNAAHAKIICLIKLDGVSVTYRSLKNNLTRFDGIRDNV